ncbi:metalloregulator ArsR/SmtB family transcription factor [Chenggangzhangella methanolivorans]|uniref:Metalloregulator ArsR/SmtB family transcription factor n=1 Tax=Chenggangzhangella methanolivorans TaxID=1437009 RepID=A0A9E6R9Z3_9HYPH|nr:metalloregulator ArsR/SmtB family transcription factor [Chenggangzhangella methanolivorans]
MVEKQLDAVFRALADPTRRGMLAALALSERSVGELAAPHAMSFAAAAKHVKVLEQAGLLAREIRGRTHVCRLAPEALAEAEAFLAPYRRFWAGKLDALEAALVADVETNTTGDDT